MLTWPRGEAVGFEIFQLRVGILDLAVLDRKVERFGSLQSRAVGRLAAAMAARRLGPAIDLRFQFRVGADAPQPCPALLEARLLQAGSAVDGHVMCHVARLRARTVPDTLFRVHAPIPALGPGAPGPGRRWETGRGISRPSVPEACVR